MKGFRVNHVVMEGTGPASGSHREVFSQLRCSCLWFLHELGVQGGCKQRLLRPAQPAEGAGKEASGWLPAL